MTSLVSLMASVFYEMFYNTLIPGATQRGLTWAENPYEDAGHNRGLVLGFRKGGLALKVLCYARSSYPAVLVSWGPTFRNANDIRDWRLLSYHDASFRESLRDICYALHDLNVSMLDGLFDGIRVEVIEQPLREYLLNEYFRKRDALLLGDEMRDYLRGRHLNFEG